MPLPSEEDLRLYRELETYNKSDFNQKCDAFARRFLEVAKKCVPRCRIYIPLNDSMGMYLSVKRQLDNIENHEIGKGGCTYLVGYFNDEIHIYPKIGTEHCEPILFERIILNEVENCGKLDSDDLKFMELIKFRGKLFSRIHEFEDSRLWLQGLGIEPTDLPVNIADLRKLN